MAGRFTLLLACALIAANLVALVVLSSERERLNREARVDQEIERIVALIPALDALEPGMRNAIARDASTRVASVSVGPEPVVATTASDPRSRALFARLAESLGARKVHAVIVDRGALPGGVERRSMNRHPNERQAHDRPGRDEPIARHAGGEIIAISIALSGAGKAWLNVTTRGAGRPRGGIDEGVILIILGLSLVAVLGVGLLFVRHLTRPLARLAEAARAAGRGDRSARVPESGAREMRDAAQSFNAMQARIAGFDAERSRTMAAVGHDLRTPITSLRIRAEMLNDEVREAMVRTLDEMTVMADGLVALARGDGEVEERRAVELHGMLAQLCADRGASFNEAVYRATEPATVVVRPVALTRALGNLIDNAIRYGHSAQVSVTRERNGAVISIEDDGPGIEQERLNQMFEPFVRGEDSRNSATGGAGLGLSIARSIIQSHGGTVELINRQVGGLQAIVVLPLVEG